MVGLKRIYSLKISPNCGPSICSAMLVPRSYWLIIETTRLPHPPPPPPPYHLHLSQTLVFPMLLGVFVQIS